MNYQNMEHHGKLRIYGDKSIPGIEITSGSLAQAPGIATGFAYCSKLDKQNFYTYVILSDGDIMKASFGKLLCLLRIIN